MPDNVDPYIQILLTRDWGLTLQASGIILAVALVGVILLAVARLAPKGLGLLGGWSRFEIDEAKLGIGSQTVQIRPNLVDKQIAYQLWVELSTRKVGLPIDLDDDFIPEIYDSWYSFFSVTRGLMKEIPVSRLRRRDTDRLIRVSIDLLNEGLRPHLTRWQARFRHWYEREIQSDESVGLDPQDIQRKYPNYDALTADLLDVNQRLIEYRHKMRDLITSM